MTDAHLYLFAVLWAFLSSSLAGVFEVDVTSFDFWVSGRVVREGSASRAK